MSQRLWTPTFIGLSLANLCSGMIFYLLVPTMAGYATRTFGATPAEGGALASLFFVGALLARLVSGWLVDRFGTRRLARAAAGCYLVTTLGYLAAPTLHATMAVRVLNGVGFGLLGSALTAGVMLTVPPARRAEGAGWYGVGASLAIGLGPFLALNLANGPGGIRAVFALAVGCAAMALTLLVVFGRGLPGTTREGRVPSGALLERRVLGVGLVMLLGGFAYSVLLSFLDEATHGTVLAAAASVYFLVYAVGVMVTRPVAGVLQDRLGERRVLPPALVLFAASLVTIGVATTGWHLLVSAVLLALGWGTVTAGGQAVAVSRAPRERTGAAVATFFFMLDLGTGLGPIVLGLLVVPLGYPMLFWIAGATAALMLPAYLVDVARAKPPAQPDEHLATAQ